MLVLLLIALALVALAAPMASAQAPAPKVTINGLIDNVASYSQNIAIYNTGLFNRKDDMWYGRTRGRFDIVGEVGKAKGVLGLELDHVYGQTGSNVNGSNIVPAGGAATTASQVGFGSDGGFELNTDSRGIIEIKWLYVEFPVPLIPIPTTARLGAQPWGAAATYKVAAYANGDFAGVNVVSQVTPNVKILGTYVQVDESLVGTDTKHAPATAPATGIVTTQNRGDDFAYVLSAEVTPFKGLDIKPMVSMFYAQGTTALAARQGRGGINTTTAFSTGSADCGTVASAIAGVPPQSQINPGTTCTRGGINEYRYTVGLDSRLRMGPFSLDPTVLYQFGERAVIAPANFADSGAVPGRKYHPDLDAWLVDIRGGFQLGPLLLEGLVAYSTGNSARDNTLNKVRYFQPLTTDTGYQADWGSQLTGLGIDYLNAWNEAGGRIAYPGVAIGWDKYGRIQVGAKATYAITPDLSVMGGANVHWTAEKVDRNGLTVAGAGIVPVWDATNITSIHRDPSRYVGTELFSVITWRFAPGLQWDNSFGYMFMGDALDAVTDPLAGPRNTNNPWMLTSRVRFSF